MPDYVYQPTKRVDDHAAAVARLRARVPNRVVDGGINTASAESVERIHAALVQENVSLSVFPIDCTEFGVYAERASKGFPYPDYYNSNFTEKFLEHFIALRLLAPAPGEVLLDIASEGSPLPAIAAGLMKSKAYAQDIMYKSGIHGDRIGGDACAMPVPDGFAASAALTCSIEHFEEDADIRLFRELARVLRPGGKVVVVPLYLWVEPAALTDPSISATTDVRFDPEATVYCAKGWNNRHGRFYSAETLKRRILSQAGFRFTVFRLTGYEPLGSAYARWALLGERL
jgi:SAM-dependent methyltransferase